MSFLSRIFSKETRAQEQSQQVNVEALANALYETIWTTNSEKLRRALEIEGNYATLRLHARQLARSSPLFKRYLTVVDEHVIPVKVEKPTFERVDQVVADEIGNAWVDYYRGPVGRNNERGLICEQKALKEEIIAGEVFVLYNKGIITHLQSEAIANPVILKNGRISKWVSSNTQKQYDANALIQVARFTDLTQCRGVTWFAHALPDAQTLSDFADGAGLNMSVLAKIIAQIVSDRDGSLSMMDAIGNSTGVLTDEEDNNADGVRTVRFRAGTFLHPEAGSELRTIDYGPGQKATSYKEQLKADVATSLDISLAALTKDYSKFNFASLQVGESDDRIMFNKIRGFWHEAYRARIFRRWLIEQSAKGDFDSKTLMKDFNNLMRPHWYGPQQPTAQPLKSAQALEKMAMLGQVNLVDLAQIGGTDAENNARIYKELTAKV